MRTLSIEDSVRVESPSRRVLFGIWAAMRELTIGVELGELRRSGVYKGLDVPHGRGERVLLVPGLMAGDSSLSIMRDWLKRIGYQPMKSDIRFNVDCPHQTVEKLALRLAESGPATVIGHSKGGLIAYALGQTHPELVNRVITLGSPIADPFAVYPLTELAVGAVRSRHAGRPAAGCCDHCYTAECTCPSAVALAERGAPRRPTVSIYSRRDGVVHWEACRRPDVASFQAGASHMGMVVNAEVYRALAYMLRGKDGR